MYNHPVFGPEKGKGGLIGKSDDQLIQELISIHNAENWLGIEGEDGGGGGGDIFGSAGATSGAPSGSVVGIGGAVGGESGSNNHLNTASGPSSCTSVHSDNGSSVGSTLGDTTPLSVITAAVLLENGGGPTVSPVGGDVKKEETLSEENKQEVMVNGGKVTVGTQTNEDEQLERVAEGSVSPGVALVNQVAVQQQQQLDQLAQGPDCVSSGSQTAMKCDDCSSGTTATGTGDNNNGSPVNITLKSCGPPSFKNDLMTYDPHCYECKVRYRDPKPKDLVMYLHALTYKVCLQNYHFFVVFLLDIFKAKFVGYHF